MGLNNGGLALLLFVRHVVDLFDVDLLYLSTHGFQSSS
jgi:hypothetical protein